MFSKIAVVGGGVNGLATGIRLRKELPNSEVQIIAEHTGDDTTSRGAGGLWKPFSLGDTPAADVSKWGEATFQHMLSLFQSPAASEAGMQLVDAYQLWEVVPNNVFRQMFRRKPMEEPFWKNIVPLFQKLSKKELDLFPGSLWTHGWKYTTMICDSQLYIRYLHKQFLEAGGKVKQKKVIDVSELAEDYDLVVNCAGLGAKALFKDDKLTAVRGQVIRVRAPWIKHYMNNNGQFYIIPNFDTVVLGGTTQKGNYNTTISQQDKERILEGSCKMVPSLRHAEVVSDWAGLRPSRDRLLISLEHQQVTLSSGGVKQLPIVHNYGHAGAGITLHWGCAADVVALVKQHVAQRQASKL